MENINIVRFFENNGKYLLIEMFVFAVINIFTIMFLNISLIRMTLYSYILSIVVLIIQMFCDHGFYIRKDIFDDGNQKIEIADCVFLNYKKNFRLMRVVGDVGAYSKINLHTPEVLQYYIYCNDIMNALFPEICEKALFLGGGGCGVPIFLSHKYNNNCNITIVEKSNNIIKASIKYFINSAVNNDKILFVNKDAFEYLKISQEQNNFIFCDLFVKDIIPDELFSKEFIQNAMKLLHDNGVLLINMGKSKENDINIFIKICNQMSIKLRMYLYQNSIVLIIYKKNNTLINQETFLESINGNSSLGECIYST